MGVRGRPEMSYGWGRVSYKIEDRLPWMNLPFPVEEYHQRLNRLRSLMARDGVDCLLVLGNRADNSNIRYLSNFEDFYGGESIVVVPKEGQAYFTTNAIMHGEPMHSGIQDCWIEDMRCAATPRTVTGKVDAVTIFDHIEDFIYESGSAGGTIGVVGDFNSEKLLTFLVAAFPQSKVEPVPKILTEMRAIKSSNEVEALRKACHIADVAMKATMDAVRPGINEFDLSAEANYAMFKAGLEHPAFPIALSTGPRSGFKHMAPTGYIVQPGDMVYINVGGRLLVTTATVLGSASAASRQRNSSVSWRRRSRLSRKL